MTEVALFQGVDPKEVANRFRQEAAKTAGDGDKDFMKMTKGGVFIYGVDENEVGDDELWAINPMSLKVGMIGWEDGAVVGEEMHPFLSDQRVDPTLLQPIKPGDSNGWKPQMSLELKSLDDGNEAIFKTSSNGGEQAFSALCSALADQLDTNPEQPVPVVKLVSTSYKHKTYGKIFKPVFEIDHWRDINGEAPKKVRGRQPKKLI